MKYHFKIHKEKKGYWAEGVEVPWANTQADTLEELRKNMKEVLGKTSNPEFATLRKIKAEFPGLSLDAVLA